MSGSEAMKAIAYFPAMIAIACATTGCATAPKPQVVRVTSDNYCRLSEPLTYSVRDTRETIDGVRRSERKRVCVCSKVKPKECEQS